tara:strand:- start:27 stop:635 length:609 start_codon:yes stop_codon:yes gene_type:complete
MINNITQIVKLFTIMNKGKQLEFTLSNYVTFNKVNSSITINLYSNSIEKYNFGNINVINRSNFKTYFMNNLKSYTNNRIKKIIWEGKQIFIINIYKKLYYSFSNNILFMEKNQTEYNYVNEYIDDGCAICLDPLFKKKNNFVLNTVIKTLCKHYFHKTCIKKWFNMNNTCPLCREKYEGFLYDPVLYINNLNNNNNIHYEYV